MLSLILLLTTTLEDNPLNGGFQPLYVKSHQYQRTFVSPLGSPHLTFIHPVAVHSYNGAKSRGLIMGPGGCSHCRISMAM